jgi:hypothetical protein
MRKTAKISGHSEAQQAPMDCVVVFLPGASGETGAGHIVADLPAGNVTGYTVRGVRHTIANTSNLPLVAGQLGKIICSVNSQHPGSDLLLLQAGVQMPQSWHSRISACVEQNPEIAALYCYNPFSGIDLPATNEPDIDPDSLVSACGTNSWFSDSRWPQGFVFLPAASVAEFSEKSLNAVTIIDRFQETGRQLAIMDSLFAWYPEWIR